MDNSPYTTMKGYGHNSSSYLTTNDGSNILRGGPYPNNVGLALSATINGQPLMLGWGNVRLPLPINIGNTQILTNIIMRFGCSNPLKVTR
jgi:hypothetical protein